MADNFGPGVTRTLAPAGRQFQAIVALNNKPPLSPDVNFIGQIAEESQRQLVASQVYSGWLIDPTQASADYDTAESYSNLFYLGRQADGELAPITNVVVNGWVIPVVGTEVEDGDTRCLVRLSPPPASDARVDLVFLEVWKARIAANPSTVNKPSASTLYKFGNTQFGGTNLPDDLIEGWLGYETAQRVQLQYRIRVHDGVTLDVYPDGLDDPTVYGQAGAFSPVSGFPFENMRQELGDPGLWRAGDGDPDNDLNTVDGYVYAVPLCAVFRRNSSGYATVESGAANQNGGFDRNAIASTFANPRDGAKELTTPTLTSAVGTDAGVSFTVTGLVGSGFDTLTSGQLAAGIFIQVDGEIIGPVASVTANTLTFAAGNRGRGGTAVLPHAAGTEIKFYTNRLDGLFSDQVDAKSILDLRHAVTFGDWDYTRLLVHNLSSLFLNNLRTTYKQSYTGDTQGVQVVEASYLWADPGVVPVSAQGVDGPDGIRTVFSDSATVQSDVTMMLTGDLSLGLNPSIDAGVDWEVGASFQPSAFATDAGYANGTILFLNIGGTDGNSGARLSSAHDSAVRAVRFVSPREYWKDGDAAACGLRTPFTLRFTEVGGFDSAAPQGNAGPGPMYPTVDSNFERPFIVLGGVLNSVSYVSAPELDEPTSGEFEVVLPGLDFDAAGGWWDGLDVASTSTVGITNTVLRGQRTLYDMLTAGGTDATGASSEVYLVLYGDTTDPENNGVVKVIGAGTAGYTEASASASDRVRVSFVVNGQTGWAATPGALTVAELRSQIMNVEDGDGGSLVPPASAVVVITDLEGALRTPWRGLATSPTTSTAVLSTTLVYNPGRAATPRVPDRVWSVSGVGLSSDYLRQSGAALDPTWASATATPSNQTPFDFSHVGSWNRLPSKGLSAPLAVDYGGGVALYSEQTRESEAFIDTGSKSLVLRPFRSVTMTLQCFDFSASPFSVIPSLVGTTTYPGPTPVLGTAKDGAAIFQSQLRLGVALPPEFMPRFGRQDIPYRVGSDSSFLEGVNHLFVESTNTATNTAIIGGRDNTTGTSQPLTSLLVQTGAGTGLAYGQYGTILPGVPAYQGRLYYSGDVVSSDLGRGLHAIQLPPYLGVARLVAVYDRRDFVANGGNTSASTNLIRRDARKQTLFILQGGAEDVTGSADDHTYMVPSNAIDIRLSPEYMDGEAFEDLGFVVQFTAFGFARGFINQNNIVLARRHDGSGDTVAAGQLTGIQMVLPLPAGVNDPFLLAYTRTPYQGDPYMTRAGSTRVVTDYTSRYGQIAVSDQVSVETPIQQFDAAGVQIPTTPNRRALQVLAAVDFYTTLGTGKIGGQVYAGTITDCAHVEDSAAASLRHPETVLSPPWRTEVRTFSEGQTDAPTASLRLVITDNSAITGTSITIVSDYPLVAGSDFAVGGSAAATAANLVAAINSFKYISDVVAAFSPGTAEVFLTAVASGAAGNMVKVKITPSAPLASSGITLVRPDGRPLTGKTASNLIGGADMPVNAGSGESLLTLTGLTERLPLGILLNDSDFVCENPLGDNASALATMPVGVNVPQSQIPLAGDSREYTPFVGGPGQWIAMADGGVGSYVAYTDATPSGSRAFRLYRGGGSAFVVSDPSPGGPLSWVAGTMPAGASPVLKGGLLTGKAMLVRNLPETAFAADNVTSHGDEVQLVVVTYGILGNGQTQTEGLVLEGEISPTGYGEGYAAADRYRIEGHPLATARVHVYESADAAPAVFPTPGPSTGFSTC